MFSFSSFNFIYLFIFNCIYNLTLFNYMFVIKFFALNYLFYIIINFFYFKLFKLSYAFLLTGHWFFKKRKKSLGIFYFNLDLFIIYLKEFYRIIIMYNIIEFISVISYFVFFYTCYTYFKDTRDFSMEFNTAFFDNTKIKTHVLLFKIHLSCFLEQTFITKLLVTIFILFKLKLLIKILFFKHVGSIFAVTFLYGQSVFIKYIITTWFFLINSLDSFSFGQIVKQIKNDYSKYKISSYILFVVILIDLAYIISLVAYK